MIKVNLADGRTLSFDLNDDFDLMDWRKRVLDHRFQKQIRGLGIVYNTQWYALPLPKNFNTIRYDADLIINHKALEDSKRKVGERIICQLDEIRLTLLVYYGNRPKMARIDAIRIGKQRYVPGV